MKAVRLLCCFFIALLSLSTSMWPSASAQNTKEQSVEKINVAVKYPKALLWLSEDFSLEWFDYKLYKVDSEKEKLSVPEKK